MLILVLLTYFLRLSCADNCCASSSCEDHCPWGPVCDYGNDASCMDTIAGPFKCQDLSKCLTFDSCDENSAALRSGHLCNRFPGYNGGYPISALKYTSDVIRYNCRNESTQCNEWYKNQENIRTFSKSYKTCNKRNPGNEKYCEEWSTTEIEIEKCWLSGNSNNENKETCCEEKSANECCTSTCDESFYNSRTPKYSFTNCSCRLFSENSTFCSSWSCQQFQSNDSTITGFSSPDSVLTPLSEESYICLTPSEGDRFCSIWTGNSNSDLQFSVSKCFCSSGKGLNSELGFCNQWECEMKGFNYYWPNPLWNVFTSILGSLFILSIAVSSLVFEVKFDVFWVLIGGILWIGGVLFIGTWQAGLNVFLISGLFLIALCSVVLFFSVPNLEALIWFLTTSEREKNFRKQQMTLFKYQRSVQGTGLDGKSSSIDTNTNNNFPGSNVALSVVNPGVSSSWGIKKSTFNSLRNQRMKSFHASYKEVSSHNPNHPLSKSDHEKLEEALKQNEIKKEHDIEELIRKNSDCESDVNLGILRDNSKLSDVSSLGYDEIKRGLSKDISRNMVSWHKNISQNSDKSLVLEENEHLSQGVSKEVSRNMVSWVKHVSQNSEKSLVLDDNETLSRGVSKEFSRNMVSWDKHVSQNSEKSLVSDDNETLSRGLSKEVSRSSVVWDRGISNASSVVSNASSLVTEKNLAQKILICDDMSTADVTKSINKLKKSLELELIGEESYDKKVREVLQAIHGVSENV